MFLSYAIFLLLFSIDFEDCVPGTKDFSLNQAQKQIEE